MPVTIYPVARIISRISQSRPRNSCLSFHSNIIIYFLFYFVSFPHRPCLLVIHSCRIYMPVVFCVILNVLLLFYSKGIGYFTLEYFKQFFFFYICIETKGERHMEDFSFFLFLRKKKKIMKEIFLCRYIIYMCVTTMGMFIALIGRMADICKAPKISGFQLLYTLNSTSYIHTSTDVRYMNPELL